MTDRVLSVGQLAKRCGVNVSTCHFYERKGLIRSSRNTGNQRRYNPDVLRRTSVIKVAQKLGVSLESIKAAFSTLPKGRAPTQNDWQRLSKRWRQELDGRINTLQRLRDNLDSCIGCGCLSLKSCPLYNPDDRLSTHGSGPDILDDKHNQCVSLQSCSGDYLIALRLSHHSECSRVRSAKILISVRNGVEGDTLKK